jgi:peroxiredoxin
MKSKRFYILLFLFAVMGFELLFVMVKNKKLENEVEKLRFILYTPSKAVSVDRSFPILAYLEFTDIGTGKVKAFGDIAGKEKVVVFVFSTDCSSCDTASEEWNAFYDEYNGRFAVFGISRNDRRSIEAYVTRNNVRFPVYSYDVPNGMEFMESAPRTIISDKTGIVVRSVEGVPLDLRSLIDK